MRSIYFAILRNRHHLAFIITLGISLNILLSDDSPGLDLIRMKASDVFSVLYSPVAWVRSLTILEEENALLREKNLQLSLQIESMLYLAAENQRLQEMLDFKRESLLKLLPAKVVSKGVTANMTSITIDVGKRDGITPNNPVLTPQGVVGKTILVGERSSIVQLLSDLNYRLSIRIMPSGATGILRWKKGNLCEVREVQKNEKVEVGDHVVTSGFSDIYPENLPVGEVIGILEERGSFQKIVTVKIFNDLGSLINVFVITDQIDQVN